MEKWIPYRDRQRLVEFGLAPRPPRLQLLPALPLLLAMATLAWLNFGRPQPLLSHGGIPAMKVYNADGDLEYRRAFGERNAPYALNARIRVGSFLHQSRLLTLPKKEFDRRYQECMDLLVLALNELDTREVPPRFLQAHTRLSSSYRFLYESLESAKLGYDDHDAQGKDARYDQAEKELKLGSALSLEGEAGIRQQLDAPLAP